MKHFKDDTTHFLSYEDPQTGADDLLDCIPLENKVDGTTQVVVFYGNDDVGTIEVVNSDRVMTVEEVIGKLMSRIISDLVLLKTGDNKTAH